MQLAFPSLISSYDSPTAWAEEAHADTVQKFGPLSPYRIETSPAAMSGMNIGTKNGDTRSGPLARKMAALFLEGLHAADAAADDDAGALRVGKAALEPGLSHGLMSGPERVLNEQVVATGFLALDVRERDRSPSPRTAKRT